MIYKIIASFALLTTGWEGMALSRWLAEQPSDFAVIAALIVALASIALPSYGAWKMFNKKETL